jgi:hypothetical protein
MRVNVYAEEMPDNPADAIEIFEKEIEGHRFTGLRIYLHLPVTRPKMAIDLPMTVDRSNLYGSEKTFEEETLQLKGPFIHRPGDDDSSAITFWGKRDLREVLREAIHQLDKHYAARGR